MAAEDLVEVRRVSILGRQGDVAGLIRELGNSSSFHGTPVRALAIAELEKLGERSAKPEIVRLLGAPDFRVRRGAVRALGRLGDGSDAPHLIEALEDPSDHVRAWALRAWVGLATGQR